MTREQAKAYLPLMAAYADGKIIQGGGEGGWVDFDNPAFSDPPHMYRIKPEPKTRPWSKPEDVPLNCWIREGRVGEQVLVVGVSLDGVMAWFWRDKTVIPYTFTSLQVREYSTDRKTWHKCEVVEEVQP